jgi:type IV pilus assembly protein PilE
MIKGEREGVTLIEVMIVVVIVGMLAAIAIPAYDNYITRSRRSDAFTALETVRAAQEMYRAERGGYAIAFVALAGCNAAMAGGNYTISLQNIQDADGNLLDDDNAYWVRAQAQEKQVGDFSFQINQDGVKQYNNAGWIGVSSWEKLPRHP